MNLGKHASYWKPSLNTRFTCESQITNSVGHFQKNSLLSSTSFTFITCFFNSWELCHIIVGLRDFSASQSFRYSIAMVLPKAVCFCTKKHWWLAASHFCSSLLRPFLSELSRQEQGPLSCSDKMAQWSAVGLGNLDLAAALRPLYLTTCTVTFGKVGWWSLNLSQ